MNSFSKISNNQVPFKKKTENAFNHILLQDMLSVKRLASKTWGAFLLAKKTQAPKNFGGDKLYVFIYLAIMKGLFFMVNAGKYTIHGSYGYRNRSLFSIFFNAGLLRDRNVGLHTCGEASWWTNFNRLQVPDFSCLLSKFCFWSSIRIWIIVIDFEFINFDEFMLLPNVEIQTSHVLPLTQPQPSIKKISKNRYLPSFSNQPSLLGWLQVLTLSMDIFFGLEVAFRVPGSRSGLYKWLPHLPIRRERGYNKRPKMEMSHAVHNLLLLILKGYSMDQLILFVSGAKAIS